MAVGDLARTILVVPDDRPGCHGVEEDDAHWWLPVLGPTAFLLLRTLVRQVNAERITTGVPFDTEVLAYRLGLNHSTGKLCMSFKRLEDFRVGAWLSTGVFSVRTELPMLVAVQLARFPQPLVQEYQDYVTHRLSDQVGGTPHVR